MQDSSGAGHVDEPRGIYPLTVGRVRHMSNDDFANWFLEQYVQRTAQGFN